MRVRAGIRCAAAFAVAMPLGTAAFAQQTTACTPGTHTFFSLVPSSEKNAPYTATLRNTFEQKLPDGNTVHGVSVIHQARDSSGKTRSEIIQDCIRSTDGQTHMRVSVSVFDPGERSTMRWETGGPFAKVAYLFRSSDATPAIKQTPEELAEQQKWFHMRESTAKEFNHEQLGTKTIDGVNASGSRTTRTIPAGEEGNDLPVVTIQERWEARSLRLVLLQSDEDPRRGKWTSEVIELTRGEPDPALFAPPEGYRVEEQKTVTTVVPPATQ